MKYKFDKARHIHQLNVDGEWKPLIGVTTALQVISKPALIQWSANMAVEYITNGIANAPAEAKTMGWDAYEEDYLRNLLTEAKSAHRKKKEEAGQKGTDVHAIVEAVVKHAIDNNNGLIPECIVDDCNIPQIRLFYDWAIKEKVKFIQCEKNLWNEELWIGGIVDLVFEWKGKRYIGDIKTSSGIYQEAFFQCGAYELCLIAMGEPKVDGYLIINLKKDGKMQMKVSENREINKEAFKSALSLHKIIKNLN